MSKRPKPKSQAERFIEAGCSEDEAAIRENMKRIAKAEPGEPKRALKSA